MTSTEFEQKIAWIETLLKKEGAIVTWDDHIPDPDNPTQSRQIDVTIRREKHLTLVECRLHAATQNVKWIEELHGRRVSLNADAIMAVSSSGFTSGAHKKADRLGIILRDFTTLTAEEVKLWGKATTVQLEYVSFFNTTLYLVTPPSLLLRAMINRSSFHDSAGDTWPLDKVFRIVAQKLGKTDRQKGSVQLQVFSHDLLYEETPIDEIIFRSNYKKRRQTVKLPLVSIYAEIVPSQNSEMSIEGQANSQFEIYRHPNTNFVIVDLSVVSSMKRSIFNGIVFDFQTPTNLKGVKIIGQKTPSFFAIPFQIIPVQKNSPEHRNLLSPKNMHKASL